LTQKYIFLKYKELPDGGFFYSVWKLFFEVVFAYSLCKFCDFGYI